MDQRDQPLDSRSPSTAIWRRLVLRAAMAVPNGWLLPLGLAALLVFFGASAGVAQGQIRPGPVYTGSNPKSATPFPRLRVVIALPAPEQGSQPAAHQPTQQPPAQPRPRDLTLVEDGVVGPHATAVGSFESIGYPLAAAVAIDVSGSMAGKPLQIVRDSLVRFVSDARPADKIAVLTIADDTVWDVPFDSDRETLKTRLQGIQSRGKLTRLYDGLLTALGGFEASLPARRELTVISDGHDEGSRSRLEDVIEMASKRGIAIDTIGLTRSSPAYLRTLSSLASATGGSFRQVHSDQELRALIENGLANMKATPVATFEAQHIRPDGKRHSIGVRWSGVGAGETTFLAPNAAAHPVRYFISHSPNWVYAALACVCAVLIVLVVVVVRRLGRESAPVAAQAYGMPPPIPAAVRAGSGTVSESPRSGSSGSLAGGAPPPVRTASPLPDAAPVVAPSLPGSPSHAKKTQIAGVFQRRSEGIAWLQVVIGVEPGAFFDVPHGDFWIGAAPGNQLVIPGDATVSSRHAYLLFEDPILILVDNHSTNGTRVNGELLRGARRPLRPGDQIQIGNTLFRLVGTNPGN